MLRLKGIVLSRKKYQESIFLDFLTTQGIRQVKSKSVLKPRAKLTGIIELFDFVIWEIVPGRKIDTLVGGKVLKRPRYLRLSLIKSLFLMSFSEITLLLVRDREIKSVFKLWLKVLGDLSFIKEKELCQYFAFVMVHLFVIEGFWSPDDKNLNSQLPANFLNDLSTKTYSDLVKKDYSLKYYNIFLDWVLNWFLEEGGRARVLKNFLKSFRK